MTAVVELVARLRARGVTLKQDGPTLVVRPAAAVRPDEVEALKQNKAEVLALLRATYLPWVDLNSRAVREAFGIEPDDEHAMCMLRFDILVALRRIESEIATGMIGSAPLWVRGRPLGDWLDLGDVARLLREWGAE